MIIYEAINDISHNIFQTEIYFYSPLLKENPQDLLYILQTPRLLGTTIEYNSNLQHQGVFNQCSSCELVLEPSPLVPLVMVALVPPGDTLRMIASHQKKHSD